MPAPDLSRLVFGAHEVVSEQELARKLSLGRPLRVKLGLDPTASDVTLGWAVVLRKLRDFQQAGHKAVLIVGDFTARVGDPSGKSETRPRLEKEVVRRFADRLLHQFWKILDQKATEVRYNSEWLEAMTMDDVLRMTSASTVARMLERDEFSKRYQEGTPISMTEFMYPLLQGMDSVNVHADVELGGTDQLFNLLVGRDLQREFGQKPQVALTVPLLEGLDGVEKMSQSLRNYVAINEHPSEMFGKLMRVKDHLIVRYLQLCTDTPADEIQEVAKGLASSSRSPRDEKRRMAWKVVSLYHDPRAADEALESFDRVTHNQLPHEIKTINLVVRPEELIGGALPVPEVLFRLGLAKSRAEARRLIRQGATRYAADQQGVQFHSQPVMDAGLTLSPRMLEGSVWQVGPHRVRRIGSVRTMVGGEGWRAWCEFISAPEATSFGRGVLLLVRGDDQESYSTFRCEVMGPSGTTYESVESIFEQAFGMNKLTVHFPGEFSPSTSLRKGSYQVSWWADTVDIGASATVYLAGHTFEVRAGGEVTCPPKDGSPGE